MKIFKDSITTLMREGYMTLQVPTITISLDGEKAETVEAPDEWFIETKHVGGLWSQNERIVVGKEQGYLHLSPIGWEANREAIRDAWDAAKNNPRGDLRRLADDMRGDVKLWESGKNREWSDFESFVQRWFEKLARTMDVEIKKAEERVRTLNVAATRFELQRRA